MRVMAAYLWRQTGSCLHIFFISLLLQFKKTKYLINPTEFASVTLRKWQHETLQVTLVNVKFSPIEENFCFTCILNEDNALRW